MPTVTVKQKIDAPVSEVFAAWNDFGNIDRYNPNLRRSFLIGDSAQGGLGATRQCDLVDGKNFVRERVIGFQKDRQMIVEIYEASVPIKYAKVTFDFMPTSNSQTQIVVNFEFTPKMGILGRLMSPLMAAQLRKGLTALLSSNRAYMEKGVVLNAA